MRVTSLSDSAESHNHERASLSSVTLAEEDSAQPTHKSEDRHMKQPQIVSGDTEKQTSDDEPPNGGIQAWLQVVACFIFFLNSWYVGDIVPSKVTAFIDTFIGVL